MNQLQHTFRRIVTGHDAQGKAIIVSDAAPAFSQLIGGPSGPTFFEVWRTSETPAVIHRQPAGLDEQKLMLAPPQNGTRIRVIEFPPEGDAIRNLTGRDAQDKFRDMGNAAAATAGNGAPHPLMHRTQTVDYGIVLEGEITLVLDEGEALARPGDIIIQNGTNHAWANRSTALCRIAFILIDGQFAF